MGRATLPLVLPAKTKPDFFLLPYLTNIRRRDNLYIEDDFYIEDLIGGYESDAAAS
jgi:hypothetical protein